MLCVTEKFIENICYGHIIEYTFRNSFSKIIVIRRHMKKHNIPP